MQVLTVDYEKGYISFLERFNKLEDRNEDLLDVNHKIALFDKQVILNKPLLTIISH
jgi:hypothetical protein